MMIKQIPNFSGKLIDFRKFHISIASRNEFFKIAYVKLIAKPTVFLN